MLQIELQHQLGAFSLDLNITLGSGLTVLFGPSGAGKTSVIHAVAGLLTPRFGRIVLGDRVLLDTQQRVHVPTHQREFAYIFQDPRLFPHLSVLENLRYGQRFLGARPALAAFDATIDTLGIGHLLARRPMALSGGEKQRVAIGRALLSSPRLILADEPLAALDEPRKDELLRVFERIRDVLNIPIVYVTHSSAEVARLADRVVRLDQGRVLAQYAGERRAQADAVEVVTETLELTGRVIRRLNATEVEVQLEEQLIRLQDDQALPGEWVVVSVEATSMRVQRR